MTGRGRRDLGDMQGTQGQWVTRACSPWHSTLPANTVPKPCRTARFPRWPLPQKARTDCELSLLLSLDLFFASLFFFLCKGLDSRIISSSSKVGSQCRRPFCGTQTRRRA